MIRLLFDERGDGHGDINFKVDILPSFSNVADSYYIYDFLSTLVNDSMTKAESIIVFINYIKAQIQRLSDAEIFIPIDLSDEYIGGILVSRKEKETIAVKYCFTRNLFGYEVSINNIDRLMFEKKPVFEIEREWAIGSVELERDLDWSISRVGNNSQLGLDKLKE
jgi:hypothetical protein